MDHGHRDLCLLQNPQSVHGIELVGHDLRLDHQRPQIDRLFRHEPGQDLAHLHHAQNLVGRPFRHRQQRMRAFIEHGANRILIGLDVDPVDFGTRRHQFTHGPLGEANDALQHLMLLMLDHTRACCLSEQHMELFGGHGALTRRPYAKQTNECARGYIQQPHHRRGDSRQHLHGPCHDNRDRHRSAQRDLFGHQLADHEAEIGRHGNDRGKARLLRPAGRETDSGQTLAHGAAKARA